jgi:hypothetical protein
MDKRLLLIFRIGLLCVGLFLLLIVDREFGVADNGDFTRYVQSYLVKPAGQDVNWPAREATKAWHDRFVIQPLMYWDTGSHPESPTWSTSANVFWRSGRALNAMFFSNDTLSIRYIGLCFFLLQAIALAIALWTIKGRTAHVVTALLVIFLALTNAKIAAFYNSFYAESVPLLAMLCMLAYFFTRMLPDTDSQLSQRLSSLLGLATLAMLYLAIFSKRQYVYFAVPATLMTYHLLFSRRPHRTAVKTARLVACGLVITGATAMLTYTSRVGNESEVALSRVTSYHALYYGLLPQSHKQDKLLFKLGLPSSSSALIGKSAWDDSTLQFIRDTPQITVKAYLKAIYIDPQAFVKSLFFNIQQIGNFDIELGMVPGAEMRQPRSLISMFTKVPTKLAGQGLFIAAILLAAAMTLFRCGLDATQFAANRLFALMLLAILCCDAVISTFDGQQEARKHLLIGSLAATLIIWQALVTVAGFSRQSISKTKGAVVH